MPILPEKEPKSDIAVVCHLYHLSLADEFRWYFGNIRRPYDLILTVQPHHEDEVRALFPAAIVVPAPNRGRDIGAFFHVVEYMKRYRVVCKVHTKVSDHRGPNMWRNYLLTNLLGSPKRVEEVLSAFDRPSVGVVCAQIFPELRSFVERDCWGPNFEMCRFLGQKMGVLLVKNKKVSFPVGSMFWFLVSAMQPLFDMGLTASDFPEGAGGTDGEIQHAIERLFVVATQKQGYVNHILPEISVPLAEETLLLMADLV